MTGRVAALAVAVALSAAACAAPAAGEPPGMASGAGASEPGASSTDVGGADPSGASSTDVGGAAPSEAGASIAGVVPAVAVTTGRQVRVVRDGVVGPARPGVVALDGATLVTTQPVRASTRVTWEHLATGASTGSVTVAGMLRAAATDGTGELVALVDDVTATPGAVPAGQLAPGRARTELVVVDREAGEVGRWRLRGNLVPEGFGQPLTPGGVPTMFLVEYLPPTAPAVYRVRWLDPLSGRLQLPVNLRFKTPVDQQMTGISRTSVYSGRHDLLFTLYRGINGDHHTGEYAFVHTLGFGNGVWCLAVPEELGVARAPGTVALTADERRVVVAGAGGVVGSYEVAAVLDAEREPVMDVIAHLDVAADARRAPAVAAAGDRVWVAYGPAIVALDAASLAELDRVELDADVAAMTAEHDGTLLVVAGDRLARVAPDTGVVLTVHPVNLPADIDALTTP